MIFNVYNIDGSDIDYSALAKETWANSLMPFDIDGFYLSEVSNRLILVDECGNYAFCPQGRFKIVYHINGKVFEEFM